MTPFGGNPGRLWTLNCGNLGFGLAVHPQKSGGPREGNHTDSKIWVPFARRFCFQKNGWLHVRPRPDSLQLSSMAGGLVWGDGGQANWIWWEHPTPVRGSSAPSPPWGAGRGPHGLQEEGVLRAAALFALWDQS